MTSPLLRAVQVSKAFGGIDVVQRAGVELFGGEVHAVVGENGAGKSTLLKILGGVHPPDHGHVEANGRRVVFSGPRHAIQQRVALIHQEPLTFPDLSVAESLFVGRQPRGQLVLLSWRCMRAQARELLVQLKVSLDVRAPVRALSIAERQMLEIAWALLMDARVLLMDEPTAALTPAEVRELFRILRELRARGVAVAFVSHRLEEVFAIADRITVMRDGVVVASRPVAAFTADQVLQAMVGRAIATPARATPAPALAPPRLRVRGLSLPGRFAGVDLEIRAGEIVGLAGLVGAGRTDVACALFGARPARRGSIEIDGVPRQLRSVREAMAAGIALVPEDRGEHGGLLDDTVHNNLVLATLPRLARFGFVNRQRTRAAAGRSTRELGVRLRSIEQPLRELSGGNQQKVVLGKWLLADPGVLLLDEPTRGIDVGAKAEVHELIRAAQRRGLAVLLISSDLRELLELSDRVAVMRAGRVVARLERDDMSEARIIGAATGQAGDPEERVERRAGRALTGLASRVLVRRELPLLAVLGVILLCAGWLEPRLVSAQSLRGILLWIPLLVVVALGEMTVMIARGIDVSVGAAMGLAGMLVAMAFRDQPGLSTSAGMLLGTGIGALLGLLNGLLIAWLRIPAIVATLGTMGVFRGLVFIMSGGRQVDDYQLPRELAQLSIGGPFGQSVVPWVVVLAGAVAALLQLWLSFTRTGRHVFAVGGNPDAATLRGLPVRRVTTGVYVLSGALAGLAGVWYASRFGTVNPANIGDGFELMAVAAAVLGGTSVGGGAGGATQVVCGCLLLGTLNTALTILHVAATWQLATYGALIVGAIAADDALRQRLAGRERA